MYEVGIQPRGRIVVAGEVRAASEYSGRLTLFGFEERLAVVRLLPGGEPDRAFGAGGRAFFSSGRRFTGASAVTVARGGALVVAGEATPEPPWKEGARRGVALELIRIRGGSG